MQRPRIAQPDNAPCGNSSRRQTERPRHFPPPRRQCPKGHRRPHGQPAEQRHRQRLQEAEAAPLERGRHGVVCPEEVGGQRRVIPDELGLDVVHGLHAAQPRLPQPHQLDDGDQPQRGQQGENDHKGQVELLLDACVHLGREQRGDERGEGDEEVLPRPRPVFVGLEGGLGDVAVLSGDYLAGQIVVGFGGSLRGNEHRTTPAGRVGHIINV